MRIFLNIQTLCHVYKYGKSTVMMNRTHTVDKREATEA